METSETYRQSQALNTLPDEWQSLGITIRIVSARWMLAIIHQLAGGAKRPSYFYKIFPGLSAKTLTVRLRELEEFQLVKREAIYQRRLKVEYELTEKGQELFALVQSLVEFSRSLDSDSTQQSDDPQNKDASDNKYDSADHLVSGDQDAAIKREAGGPDLDGSNNELQALTGSETELFG